MTRVCSAILGLLLAAQAASAQRRSCRRFASRCRPAGRQCRRCRRATTRSRRSRARPRIRGHVVAADTGQPLRKAQVRISSPDFRENRMTTTDADGRYEFKELPAGRYNVQASKGSYVQLQYGQLRPFEPGKPLEILEAQTVEKVDFALPQRRRDHRAHPRRVRRAAGRRAGRGDALPEHGRPPPADARRAAGDDQRHRRVPAVRDPARPVLPLGDAAQHGRHDGPTPTTGPAMRRPTSPAPRTWPKRSGSRSGSARSSATSTWR